ncbi:hypothetical protein RCO27_17630 [Sphingosinicella sp. LHD-64]|uniref:hypothetical protein n=1 Tax=Sphingosinicella sp. LHD-64 TaxID=3072139 RepID=UPI00280F27BC|nr:hypothetical protein [Sphingosinicella sp. LHD-64]MDQ8758051.1 hypothetical protein [Sphingosinicella sp. LHD-64]
MTMAVRTAFPLALLLLAGACARSEDASVVADTNGQTTAVERVRTPEQDDNEVALGEWRDSLQDDAAALEFGPAGAPPLFSLRCDGRRGTLLQRHGAALTGDLPTMLITVGSDTRRFAVTSTGGTIPMLRATLTSGDPFRQTLTAADSPITIRIGDSPPLVLPPGDQIGAFLTACASGETAGAAADEAGNAAAPEANGAEAATNGAATQ